MFIDSNNNRIAKNTIILYIRMLFSLLVNLYASRVILQVLGITDFGIYNVVGGFVIMFSFLNTSLASASQRFLTFELGKRDNGNMELLFNMLTNIHVIISCVLVLFLETFGLYFFIEIMNIPENRATAALYVFHFSVITLFMSIMSTPYNALIIAYENMKIYAYIDILNTIGKLLIIFIIPYFFIDKLIIYAFLLCIVSIFIRLLYSIYCYKQYPESRFKLLWNNEIFKQVMTFLGWISFSAVGSLAKKNGLNILINIFIGVVANAAVGIAYQVNLAINNFTNNFQMAFVPQLVKSYAEGNILRTRKIVFSGAKICSLLLMILSIPILIETEYILKLWLGKYPTFTPWLVRLVLIETFIRSVAYSMNSAIRANAKIKTFELVNNLILFLSLFLCFLVLYCEQNIYMVFFIEIIVAIISTIYTIIICSNRIDFKIKDYFYSVIVKIFFSFILVIAISYIPYYFLNESFMRLAFVCLTNLICSLFIIYFYSLSNKEKEILKKIIKK